MKYLGNFSITPCAATRELPCPMWLVMPDEDRDEDQDEDPDKA